MFARRVKRCRPRARPSSRCCCAPAQLRFLRPFTLFSLLTCPVVGPSRSTPYPFPLRLMHPGVRCLEPTQRLAVAFGALIAPLTAAVVEAQRIAIGSRCCAVHAAHHLRVQAPAQRRATAKMAQAQNRGQLEPAVVSLLAWHDGQVPFLP
jgi:hypothetical protein